MARAQIKSKQRVLERVFHLVAAQIWLYRLDMLEGQH